MHPLFWAMSFEVVSVWFHLVPGGTTGFNFSVWGKSSCLWRDKRILDVFKVSESRRNSARFTRPRSLKPVSEGLRHWLGICFLCAVLRSEEHTSELQSHSFISSAL